MKRALLLLLLPLLLISCRSNRAVQLAQQGYEQMLASQYDEASVLYEKAFELQKSNAEYRYNHLLGLYLSQAYEQTAELAGQAFESFPHYLEFLQLQANAYAELRQYEKALETYQRLFTLNPATYDLQVQVMKMAVEWEQVEVAQTLAQRLLTIPGQEKQALEVLASTTQEPNWYQYALSYLTKATPK